MSFSRTLSLILCLLPLLSLAEPALSPASSLPATTDRSGPTVQFDFNAADPTGVASRGKRPVLTIHLILIGQPMDQDVMVILEGDGVGRAMVPMIPSAVPASLSAGVALDPARLGATSPMPNLLRIEATFARAKGMRLHRFLTRVVYVTLTPSEVGGDLQAANIPPGSGVGEPEAVPGESRPGVPAASEEIIAETDLVVRPPPSSLSGYWGEVKRLMNRSWHQQIKPGPRSERGGVPRVRFRLLADGHVPLIQIERSSGNQRLDEVALQAVVTAQPFPPFPSYLQDNSVDVHIDLRPGR